MKLIESLREKAGAALNWPGYIEVKADAVLALCDAAEALKTLMDGQDCREPDCEACIPARAALAKLDALEQKP